MVWACDEKRDALRRKEGDGNETTEKKEEIEEDLKEENGWTK